MVISIRKGDDVRYVGALMHLTGRRVNFYGITFGNIAIGWLRLVDDE